MVSPYTRQWQLLTAVWLLFGTFIVWNIYTDYGTVNVRERDRLAILSRVVDENIQAQLHATDDALNSIRNDFSFLLAQKDGKLQLNRRLKAMTDAMVGVRTIIILDADGLVAASSDSKFIGKKFYEKQYYPAALKNRNPATLYVSAPFKTTQEAITMRLMKVIPNERGMISGIIAASLDPTYFNTMLNSVLYTQKMRASITDGDGQFFVTSPKSDSSELDIAKPGSIFTQYRQSGKTATVLTGMFDRIDQQSMAAIRTIHLAAPPMDKPLIVVLSRDLENVFSLWRREVYGQVGTFVLLILFSFAGLSFHQRRQRKYNEIIAGQEIERRKAEEKIKELAFFDQMTRLPNRILLLDRLKQAMAANSRTGHYGALLFIDLDNFKNLNDTLGHDIGDMLLKQVAKDLILCVREADTVARFGGDEFVVILSDLNANEKDAAKDIGSVAKKILAALNRNYLLGEFVQHSTASVGIAMFRGDLITVDALMKQADLAMYKSKAAGRNALHFFDPEMEIVVIERAAREADLRHAVHENQLFLHYQAQVVGEGRLIGAEVLVRWQHLQRGMVSPAEFIPLAEETGIILALGSWVMQTACAQLKLWAMRPEMAHLTMSVNVSAYEFRQSDFVDKMVAILLQTGANPNRLKIELTESTLVDNVEDVIAKMFALKSKGVGFSLDDFGTGYSSLSYLKRLPLDQLKIDQSFVRDVLNDPNDAAIASTIVTLAKSLGLGVIAEGVETEAQRDFLASAGCHVYQGYLFSRPLPLSDFEKLVRKI